MKKILAIAVALLSSAAFVAPAMSANFEQEAKLTRSIVVTGGYIGSAANNGSTDSVNAIQAGGAANSISYLQDGGSSFQLPLPASTQSATVNKSLVATVGIIGSASNNNSYGSANVIASTGAANSLAVTYKPSTSSTPTPMPHH